MADLNRIVIQVSKDGSKEEITFSGFWTGMMLKRAMAHLPRQYRLYMRDIRRGKVELDQQPEEKPFDPTKGSINIDPALTGTVPVTDTITIVQEAKKRKVVNKEASNG